MSIINNSIQKAVALLNQDEVIAIPTETVYGLAGNIFSPKAIASIFSIKERPSFNPLIVHIKSVESLPSIAREIPEKAMLLANAFWPGPLTMVLKKQPQIPDSVTAGKDTVAIRVPNHKVTLSLLEQLDFPLAAPSANPFGSISPTQAVHVAHYFENKLPMILEGGSCERGIESTIIGFEDGEPVLYRLGSLAIEDLEAIIGPLKTIAHDEKAPPAPGMLSRHYAPNTTTYLTDTISADVAKFANQRVGVLTFKQEIQDPSICAQEVLSISGSMLEAASGLYAALHRLDEKNLDAILAERCPDSGLGKAINDRLQRATKK
ncbi:MULTISPECIES: L-threonylcarbamoyladenylate synthase [unclassified Flavobacterium]|uniref:L-threonylcarbamoyladenylate synthase n=1 Tax=unclassified Flavobacterium TaxID=196869 RepID=UPI00131A8536|nr:MULTISPECIES: L-threonylcarbamoyladenylate synthase [unclassified Flavobacterium]